MVWKVISISLIFTPLDSGYAVGNTSRKLRTIDCACLINSAVYANGLNTSNRFFQKFAITRYQVLHISSGTQTCWCDYVIKITLKHAWKKWKEKCYARCNKKNDDTKREKCILTASTLLTLYPWFGWYWMGSWSLFCTRKIDRWKIKIRSSFIYWKVVKKPKSVEVGHLKWIHHHENTYILLSKQCNAATCKVQ